MGDEQTVVTGMPIMDAPLYFVSSDPDSGKWQINPEALSILDCITCPLSIVSITGKYRTGKSYLMNRLFNEKSGFELGATIQSKTKGIWMWARPHPNGDNRCLVLLDTEGLSDSEKGDPTQDIQLFTLILLLSNCLIYNAVGTLDDDIIQRLELVTELTEYVKVKKESGEEESGNAFSKYFPAFYLVLRDFFLELEVDGKRVTADEYFEHSLKPRKGVAWTRKDMKYNMPRNCIRAFFPRRFCFTLPKPMQDADKLRHLESVPVEEINADFQKECSRLVLHILNEAAEFMLEGNIINGSRYRQMVESYVEAINSGNIPCIESTHERLKQNECTRAVEEAGRLYVEKMSSEFNMPVDSEVLQKAHELSHRLAMEHYEKIAFRDESGYFAEKVMSILEEHLQAIKNENEDCSRKKCGEALQHCFGKFEEALRSGQFAKKGGHAEYKHLKEEAIAHYVGMPDLGLMKEELLNDFLQSHSAGEEAIIQVDNALEEKDKELVRKQKQIEQEEAERKVMEQQQLELRKELERQQQEHFAAIRKFTMEVDENHRRKLEEQKKDTEAKEREYERMMQQGNQRQAEQYKILLEEMKKEKEREERDYQLQSKAIEEYKQQQQALIDDMRKQSQLQSAQLAQLRDQLHRKGQKLNFDDLRCNII